jgi:uncharacterized protein YecE (DUF72 family)
LGDITLFDRNVARLGDAATHSAGLMAGQIRIGIGGWTFEPWRGGVFYPADLKQKDELAYASRRLTAIEINGTFYSRFSPSAWRAWREATPDGFVFTVKGGRVCTNRAALADAGEAVTRFFAQGIAELGDRLGPILWQLPHNKRFNADDLGAFLSLLPRSLDGLALRHAVEPRHASFLTPDYVRLLQDHGVANVYARHARYPEIADATADFVYARLQTGADDEPAAYPPAELDAWAARLRQWSAGESPADLPLLGNEPAHSPRDVFAFIIHDGKMRAPAGAMALIDRVRRT